MHVENIGIENFKTFFKRQQLSLEPGFNLLVGANNAGKTSVLEVLDLEPSVSDTHRSVLSMPDYGDRASAAPNLSVGIRFSVSELKAMGQGALQFPIQEDIAHRSQAEMVPAVRSFLDSNATVLATSIFGGGTFKLHMHSPPFINSEASSNESSSTLVARVSWRATDDANVDIFRADSRGVMGDARENLRQRIYRFSAQRRPGWTSGAGNTVLDREAIGLPFCINHLQTIDAHGHKLLCDWVHRVFPSIRWVQAPPSGGNFQIYCLPQPPEARREDLAVPMSAMGSGIGNVLAMLYVVLTSRHPQVIAIDEPNAFLHPRALRELLTILGSEGKQHQYILSAHSADVLTAVAPKTISHLQFDGVSTTVNQIGPSEIHNLRGGLADLGIRITDLHAKDSVLWVEGQTEELVFPDLLRWACPEVAAGIAVLRVERTGTFNKKGGLDPAELAGIYERLSRSSALVPPMVCVVLDGETLSSEKRREVEAASKGKLRYLERRMLENYLLSARAIAAALGALGELVAPIEVERKLAEQMQGAALESIDAAKVISALFAELTDARQEFRKTRDVENLVSYLLEEDPEFLLPIKRFLRALFGLPVGT